jgi:hypothetical protein
VNTNPINHAGIAAFTCPRSDNSARDPAVAIGPSPVIVAVSKIMPLPPPVSVGIMKSSLGR